MGHVIEGNRIRKEEKEEKPEPYETSAWKTYGELKREEVEIELG